VGLLVTVRSLGVYSPGGLMHHNGTATSPQTPPPLFWHRLHETFACAAARASARALNWLPCQEELSCNCVLLVEMREHPGDLVYDVAVERQ
jgi:hypothetical protein